MKESESPGLEARVGPKYSDEEVMRKSLLQNLNGLGCAALPASGLLTKPKPG